MCDWLSAWIELRANFYQIAHFVRGAFSKIEIGSLYTLPQVYCQPILEHIIHSSPNAGLIHPFFLLILDHWPWPRVMSIKSNREAQGTLIYTLPQKKCNLQEPAFLLGKSVGDVEFDIDQSANHWFTMFAVWISMAISGTEVDLQ